jgi:hypothetical protein
VHGVVVYPEAEQLCPADHRELLLQQLIQALKSCGSWHNPERDTGV